jgi:hypothetical protein
MVFCPAAAVVMLESQATYSTQCTQLVNRLSTSQQLQQDKIIGSETQSDLLMMGVKTPETF